MIPKHHAPQRLTTLSALRATLASDRAVVSITVDWSGQERASRRVFAGYVERMEQGYPDMMVGYGIVDHECPGVNEWFTEVDLRGVEAGGHGPVIWLRHGKLANAVHDAAETGIDGLVEISLGLW